MKFSDTATFLLIMAAGVSALTLFIFACSMILNFLRLAEPIREPRISKPTADDADPKQIIEPSLPPME